MMKKNLSLILTLSLLVFATQIVKTQQSANTTDLMPDILTDNILEHITPISVPTTTKEEPINITPEETTITIDNGPEESITEPISAPPAVSPEALMDNKPTNKQKRWTIDKIIARVNGTNILKSDLEQPRITKDGGLYDLNEMIMEELFFQKASEKHLMPTIADIDRQIVSLKIQNEMADMPEEEFERQLKESGFTLLNYKQQLGRLLAVENIKRAEVSEKIVVSSQQVEDYYNQTPEYLPEEFLLEIAPIDNKNIADYKKLIQAKKVSWQNLGWVEKDQLDKQYSVVLTMKKNAISKPIKKDGKHYVVKLVDKQDRRLKSLDERYGEIERRLHVKKRDKLFDKLQNEIREKANIIYL